MRIAFYAPMKPPDSPVPSGDRETARSLIRALETAGHEVDIASRFVSRDGKGDPARQARLRETGERLADRLIRRWRQNPPDMWLTYHLYHKTPDWLGPPVAAALGIPYFAVEVSHAPKRAGGPWDIGYRGAEAAIRAADGVIGLSSLDAACVLPLLADPGRYHRLLPFTDTAPFASAADDRKTHRANVRAQYGLKPDRPLLLAVGMMRDGDKLASYRVLGEALAPLENRDWQLLVVGDGPARPDVERALERLSADRVRYAGVVSPTELPRLYTAADLLVWPAVNEAFGVALLEAQATGLPVVAGRTGGVPDIVRDGETGLLTPPRDAGAFATAVGALLDDKPRRHAMAARARAIAADEHDLAAAAAALDRIFSAARKARAA